MASNPKFKGEFEFPGSFKPFELILKKMDQDQIKKEQEAKKAEDRKQNKLPFPTSFDPYKELKAKEQKDKEAAAKIEESKKTEEPPKQEERGLPQDAQKSEEITPIVPINPTDIEKQPEELTIFKPPQTADVKVDEPNSLDKSEAQSDPKKGDSSPVIPEPTPIQKEAIQVIPINPEESKKTEENHMQLPPPQKEPEPAPDKKVPEDVVEPPKQPEINAPPKDIPAEVIPQEEKKTRKCRTKGDLANP